MIELLVVIAIIGVLTSLVLPALSGAKEKGRRMVCMQNKRQLAQSYLMYVDDHRGRLLVPYGLPWMDWNAEYTESTNWWALTRPERNRMAPYTGTSWRVYKCPQALISG